MHYLRFIKGAVPYLVLGMLLSLLLPPSSSAQSDSWVMRQLNMLFNDSTSSAKPRFLAYPTIAYSPETSWEFGASALYVYYTNQDTANRLSEINAFTFVTLEQQYGLWLDHALYSNKNRWFYLGKIRYQQFPLLYYGIGPDTRGTELANVEGTTLSIRERVLRQLTGGLYLGVELDINQFTNVAFEPLATNNLTLPAGSEGSANLGLGLGLVYDERHNVLNVRKGFFGELGFLRYDNAWRSDYLFTNYFLDARYYYPTTPKQVLATQFYTNIVRADAGSSVPFNQLALMGGETLMRGYYLGRYRDNVLMASQVEYRFLPFSFSKRIGAAAFLSTGGVAPALREVNLGDWKVAGGAGIRILLFPAKDIFTRFDVAATEEGLGYYFFIGEAF